MDDIDPEVAEFRQFGDAWVRREDLLHCHQELESGILGRCFRYHLKRLMTMMLLMMMMMLIELKYF